MFKILKTGVMLSCLGLAACGVQTPPQVASPSSYGETKVAAVVTPPPLPPKEGKIPLQQRLRQGPEALKGAEVEELIHVLGQPKFRRRESQSELWQYRQPECTLDVFLYKEGESSKVKHFEVRSLGANKASAEECLNVVMQRKL